MNNVIIGTAGHVDHGKTSLIKALTGVDTDRLIEEKKRGITIELGFAHLELDDGTKLGIVDVPGHEKFIKNMLAGAGGIDIALLIVAANEGVSLQTREHFDILKLLDIKKGIIVITKCDTVESDFIELVKSDISELVSGSFLEFSQIIETSAYKGIGIDELKVAIKELVKGSEKDLSLPFRIPIDRIFSVDGFGTVITGTLIEGKIKKGDNFCIYPKGLSGKVRNIQVHDTDSEEAFSGQRVAINLSGVRKEELSRGDVVAKPNSIENTYIVDVKLNLTDTKRTIKNGSRLHLYHGAKAILCKVILLDRDELKNQESCYAQLRLEEKVALKYRDRYIVRFYSPLETVGGGIILNPLAKKRIKGTQGLEIMENGNDYDVVENIINEKSFKYPEISKIETIANMPSEKFNKAFNKLKLDKKIVIFVENFVISKKFLIKIGQNSSEVLKDFHEKNPFKKGMNIEEYKTKVLNNMPENLLQYGINALIEENIIILKGSDVSDPKFKVKFNDGHIKIANQIEKTYLDAGFIVPNRDDVLKMFKDKSTNSIMSALISDGTLVLIDKQIMFHREYYEKAIQIVKDSIIKNGKITLGEFRDMILASRKYAVLLLEHFDQKKITKKVDDYRILL